MINEYVYFKATVSGLMKQKISQLGGVRNG